MRTGRKVDSAKGGVDQADGDRLAVETGFPTGIPGFAEHQAGGAGAGSGYGQMVGSVFRECGLAGWFDHGSRQCGGVFVEQNARKPGDLAEAGIGIHTLTLADTQQFGLLRLIVTDWEEGRAILEQAGYLVNVTEVVAVEVADRPGGLVGLLDLFEAGGINIEYMYAFTFGREDKAVLVFRFDQPDAAIDRLRAAGINVVNGVELGTRIHA